MIAAFLSWLRGKGRMHAPPRSAHDPELAEHRITAILVIDKAERAVERAKRLDAALTHAENVIRGRAR